MDNKRTFREETEIIWGPKDQPKETIDSLDHRATFRTYDPNLCKVEKPHYTISIK